MCVACVSYDAAKAEAFSGKLLDLVNGGALALMLSLGHRTGLFDVLADGEEVTSHELAAKAGLNERYVREWLGAMACAKVLELNAFEEKYRLPAEHAAWLTRASSPNNIAAVFQWFAVLGGAETQVAEAFRHGKGVPYSAYSRFDEVMAEESGQTVVAGLDSHILPLVPELVARLESGIDVLDVGCGRGQAILALAERFPRSRFFGYDFNGAAIAAGNWEASRRKLSNVQFAQRDAAAIDDVARFDLITTFDAIHDQSKPAAVLANIRRALKPGGVYLCQEIKGESSHGENLKHPLGTFLYTISTMHCMSVSLANGGPGLGAMWGRRICRKMLSEAGFENVKMHELGHDITNDWYVCAA